MGSCSSKNMRHFSAFGNDVVKDRGGLLSASLCRTSHNDTCGLLPVESMRVYVRVWEEFVVMEMSTAGLVDGDLMLVIA